MQGRWVDADDGSAELHIDGGEVSCFGAIVNYDYKLVTAEDDALTVTLAIDDPVGEDAFQRANITGLVITPEGEFHAYNTQFASEFVRGD